MAEGYKHIVYKGPLCNQINREANLRWDKHTGRGEGLSSFVPVKADGRGDKYAVLSDGHEVYMIVATAASYKKRGMGLTSFVPVKASGV